MTIKIIFTFLIIVFVTFILIVLWKPNKKESIIFTLSIDNEESALNILNQDISWVHIGNYKYTLDEDGKLMKNFD